ncbi:MAG: hypothetical protein K9M03_02275 [Kiritimatiellales bacterium]|nr:hypothetical protein [Kiritimatiellales bacterium]
MRKTLLYVLIIFLIICAAGIALGFLYASLPGHHPQENRQACESVGGDWSDEQRVCLLSYKEGGEPCKDGGQCISGICFPPELSDEQKIAIEHESIKNIVGTCYADEFASGCVKQVIMGTVSKESLCLNN